jgi:hypothetical protein
VGAGGESCRVGLVLGRVGSLSLSPRLKLQKREGEKWMSGEECDGPCRGGLSFSSKAVLVFEEATSQAVTAWERILQWRLSVCYNCTCRVDKPHSHGTYSFVLGREISIYPISYLSCCRSFPFLPSLAFSCLHQFLKLFASSRSW